MTRFGNILCPEHFKEHFKDLPAEATDYLAALNAKRKIEDDTGTCDHCGGAFPTKELKRCEKCRIAWYCSVEDQRAAWKTHKEQCFDAASK
jgi:hypothetical protein